MYDNTVLLQMQDKNAGTTIFPWKVAKVVKTKKKPMQTVEEDDM